VKLWPRSLFGRLALLLIAVVAIALVATIAVFRQDRAALLVRAFGDQKIAQLAAVRAALESSDAAERRETVPRIGREFGVRIVSEAERPLLGAFSPVLPQLRELEAHLQRELGPDTEVRAAPGRGLLFVRVVARGAGYWIGFPLPPRPQVADEPWRPIVWSLLVVGALLAAAYGFARYLARPLRDLNAAVERVGRGESPPPLPESGASEIANLNRGFNRMTANLRQLEQDRALLLAGVSHDLRTPLARLRIGVEMAAKDEPTRAGMVGDIEEMDRIIGQFLEFARTGEEAAQERRDPNAIVAACVERCTRAGRDVRFAPGPCPPVALRPTAFSRLVANLVDNALAYGAPPVEVTTAVAGGKFTLDVADRGPGIAPADVERLKQPFTRASASRTNAAGVAGAGLGLAIVDRIARLHGGSFDLLPRDGGGTLARVTLPA
jgi:two-component system osmolarity sensor histidine kinase EnvZ